MRRRTFLAGAAAAGAPILVDGRVPPRQGTAASAAPPLADSWRGGLDRLRRAMAARVALGELPGIVTMVAYGDVVHVDTIGVRLLSGHDPMRRDTPFRIASMTKPILAAATMMLVEDGTLRLDEPVDRLLPELAHRRVLTRIDGPLDQTVPANRPITVEDLLTFRLGYGMIFQPAFEPPYPIINAANDLQLAMGPPDPPTPHHPDEWIRRFGTLPLMYQPGERWQYNAGSLVLGVLVARASGRRLDEAFRCRVFEPLGMKRTGFAIPASSADRLPGLYLTNPQTGKLELLTASPPSQWTRPPAFPSGAAGLVSTVEDYLAFSRLLLNHGVHRNRRLLSEQSVRLLTTNHLTPHQIADANPPLAGRGWGYGMAVTVAPDQISPTPGRYGWDGGYGTSWFTDPNRNLTAMALTQTIDFLFNGGLTEFQRLAAGIPPPGAGWRSR
jgi:CubicO group peptidase (beta-lactamase class C family)